MSLKTRDLLQVLDVPFTFAARPVPLAPELRRDWRLVLVLLILRVCCRQGKSTLHRLHVLSWAARTREGRERLLRVLHGNANPDDIIVRIEPALNRALDFGVAEGLVTVPEGGQIQLTDRGAVLADEVHTLPDCLVDERLFLNEVRPLVSETAVRRLLKLRAE